MKRALLPGLALAIAVFLPHPAIAAFSGHYKVLARHSGKGLNVSGAGTADGARVIQWTYTAAAPANDEWELVDAGGGFHRLVARHSGKVLTVAGAGTANGAVVEQRAWASADHQMWQVTDLGTGYFRITARHSGKALDVSGNSTADGATVHQWTPNGGNNQQWQIVPVGASSLEGPGLPKLTFTAAELFKPIGTILPTTSTGEQRGLGLTTMHKGWLATVPATDSGRAGGGFAFYDVSNPRSPQLVAKRDVPSLREQHGFARSAPGAYPGDYVVLQAGTGIEFWDWTDVRNPVLLKAMALPGVAFSDYTVGSWWLAWQAPFVYVAASGNGIFIVDATNPRSPTVVRQIPTSQTGGFRIHPDLRGRQPAGRDLGRVQRQLHRDRHHGHQRPAQPHRDQVPEGRPPHRLRLLLQREQAHRAGLPRPPGARVGPHQPGVVPEGRGHRRHGPAGLRHRAGRPRPGRRREELHQGRHPHHALQHRGPRHLRHLRPQRGHRHTAGQPGPDVQRPSDRQRDPAAPDHARQHGTVRDHGQPAEQRHQPAGDLAGGHHAQRLGRTCAA